MHNIAVFGASGLVGSAIANILNTEKNFRSYYPTHNSYDLTKRQDIDIFFSTEKIDTVIMCAGKVGGIFANMNDPYGFLLENVQMTVNVIESSRRNKIPNLIYLSSSCVYPRNNRQPMCETDLLTGSFEPTNEGYALAKTVGVKMVEYLYTKQNMNYVSLLPCNIYGPNDNWTESGHVMTALIKNIHSSMQKGEKSITIRGTGNARREFLHSYDLADAVVHILKKMHEDRLPYHTINVGSGSDYSISQYARMIADHLEYNVSINTDSSYPDGMPQKLLDVSRIHELGWNHNISIGEGIDEMIMEYENGISK